MGQATILDDSVGDWELEKHLMRKATWNVELGRWILWKDASRYFCKFWKPLNKDVHGKVLSGERTPRVVGWWDNVIYLHAIGSV